MGPPCGERADRRAGTSVTGKGAAVHDATQLVAGRWPPSAELATGRLAAVCVVRDGDLFVDAFVDHHLSLGVEHVYVLDNGSVDGTIDVALARAPDVTVVQCTLPFNEWETQLKRYLVAMAGSAHDWVALLDIDEFLDWPGRSVKGARDLLDYLDGHGFSAMLNQMLDMFPRTWAADASADFDRRAHRFYDLADLKRVPYQQFAAEHMLNATAPDGLAFHLNGFRWRLFGLSRALWLTKHALLRPNRGASVSHPHLAQDVAVADVTGVLLHYHFTGRLEERVAQALEDHRYGWSADEEYGRYSGVLTAGPRDLVTATTRELIDVDQLVDEGFLQRGTR